MLCFKALKDFENTYLHKHINKIMLLVICMMLVSCFNLCGKVKTISFQLMYNRNKFCFLDVYNHSGSAAFYDESSLLKKKSTITKKKRF